MGTYRLGIVLLSADTFSEQKLYRVKLSSDYDYDYDNCAFNNVDNTTFSSSKSTLTTQCNSRRVGRVHARPVPWHGMSYSNAMIDASVRYMPMHVVASTMPQRYGRGRSVF